MKKQIVVSSIIAAAILGGTVILSVAKAEGPKNTESQLLATNSVISPSNPIIASASKTETVYVMTEGNGDVKSKFIGSTLYSGNEELPFSMNATYYLNGTEISPKDLAGKSGHVKIVFNYNSTAKKNSSFIPFIALTTINLDHQKFTNIKLSNGKIFNENDTTYTVIGYGITGLNQNLGTDFLPDQFVFEADATNFNMTDAYTIFTSDILADIDTSKLSGLDSLTNSIYQLSDALDQIIAGATKLSNGVDSLTSGISKLQSGADTINSGAGKLATGLSTLEEKVKNELIAKLTTLATSLTSLSGNSGSLNTNVRGAFTNIITNLSTIASNTSDATTAAQINALINSLSTSLPTLYTNLGTYTGYVDAIATEVNNMDTSELTTGIAALSNGANNLYAGTTTFKNGMDTLASGANELSTGSKTLKNGLITFKTSGIDKLVSFASKDLTSFTRNLRSSIAAASSYKSFGGIDAKSVKFIVKTPSI